MICGDFNARSSLWDQHGTNQQGCALEAALSDVLFTPVTTASPTHPGTRQGDTDSTIDLALVSPKLVPWTRAETLTSHGSDHLPVVFSLQKAEIKPRRKPQYPFQYGMSDTGVMSKLRAHKPVHTTNLRQKAVIQPPWWNKETQAAWTDKRTKSPDPHRGCCPWTPPRAAEGPQTPTCRLFDFRPSSIPSVKNGFRYERKRARVRSYYPDLFTTIFSLT